MKRTVTSILLLGLAAAGPDTHSARPPARPAAPPATQPAAPRPFPQDYQVLLNRSIFSGRNAAAKADAKKPAPEAGLALDGVVEEDTACVALVEDTANHRTIRLRVGDALGPGRVRRISLHGIEFGKDGLVADLAVGQTLQAALALADAQKTIHQRQREEASAR